MNARRADRQQQEVAGRAAILDLLGRRRAGATICPSEAARLCDADEWRAFMDPVRSAAQELAETGIIQVTQQGSPVNIDAARGPIRLQRGPRWGGA